MEQIILSENCFGLDVEVNGESLFTHEYDNRDPEFIKGLKLKLINSLVDIVDNLDIADLAKISDIVVENGNYEMDNENSTSDDYCEQCGNYNYNHIYNKTK